MNNNLQDKLLSKIQKERRMVTVFVINGFQMKGRITGFDRYTVVLEAGGEQQMVFKHAISTIQPNLPVDLDGLDESDSQADTYSLKRSISGSSCGVNE